MFLLENLQAEASPLKTHLAEISSSSVHNAIRAGNASEGKNLKLNLVNRS